MRVPLQLTPPQQAAIASNATPLLLVASAGSGKTEVLTRRVIRHLEESSGETYRILAVTFTVRAAQELQQRIRATAAAEAWRVDADTIHAFALDWLLRFGQSVGIYPDTVVYSDDADRLSLLSDVLRRVGEDPTSGLKAVLDEIDDVRTQRRIVDPAATLQPLTGGAALFSEVYEGYLNALAASSGIDFPGMLATFLAATELDPAFLGNFWSTYRYVLVDEGQDLSAAQSDAIAKLASEGVHLFVVADDRQSITGYAGGGFKNVRRLVGEHAFASRLHLPHNFRCATSVLVAAERLAGHLLSKPPKALAMDGAPTGEVRVAGVVDQRDEARTVCSWGQELVRSGLPVDTLAEGEDSTVIPDEVAIIARARWLLDEVIAELKGVGLPVSLQTEPQEYLSSPHGRILVEGLAVVASGASPPAMRRICGELWALGAEPADPGSDLLSLLRNVQISGVDVIANCLDGLTVDTIPERLDSMASVVESESWRDDVGRLQVEWQNYSIAVPRNQRTLSGFMRHLFRVQQTRPSDPGVRVLTIHRVKGLEFKAVAVIGAYEGALPDWRAKDAAAVDEERRAFYVALTRAARSVLITYPRRTTDRSGRTHAQAPSRFIHEAGLL